MRYCCSRLYPRGVRVGFTVVEEKGGNSCCFHAVYLTWNGLVRNTTIQPLLIFEDEITYAANEQENHGLFCRSKTAGTYPLWYNPNDILVLSNIFRRGRRFHQIHKQGSSRLVFKDVVTDYFPGLYTCRLGDYQPVEVGIYPRSGGKINAGVGGFSAP